MPRPQTSEHSQAAEPITGPTADDVDYFRAALREAVGHGLAITSSMAAQAKADPVPHPFWGNKAPVEYPTEHLSACYDSTTRSIRRCIALALTLHHLPARSPRVLAANDEHPREPKAPPAAATQPGSEPAPASDACEPPDRPDRPDWHEPDESELFANDAARPADDVIAEIRLDYAAQGHPILSPVPPPPEPSLPSPLPLREGPGVGRAQMTMGKARTEALTSRKPHPPPK